MPRYAFLIEYDGAPFRGWQRQAGLPSVQAALEAALARLDPGAAASPDGPGASSRARTDEGANLSGPVPDGPGTAATLPLIYGAGRTDTGVHATGQVAHADLARDWDPFRLAGAVNAHLRPLPVAVLAVARVSDDFHARFSAIERRYTYRIVNRRAPLTLEAGQAWRVQARLDAAAMQRAGQALVGLHDFTTFRSVLCQAKSPVKTLDELRVEQRPIPGGTEILVHLRARSFLHNQVRSIVGSLERVGAGNWPEARLAEALAARSRAACGPVAPPDGLVLTRVLYPEPPFA